MQGAVWTGRKHSSGNLSVINNVFQNLVTKDDVNESRSLASSILI